MQIGQAHQAQVLARFLVQAAQAFNRIHLSRQVAEQGRLVAAPGADLQHPAKAARSAVHQQLQHARDHAGLGDGLPQANRQAGVFIGLVDQGAVYKPVPFDRAKGGQYLAIRDAALRQFGDHVGADGG